MYNVFFYDYYHPQLTFPLSLQFQQQGVSANLENNMSTTSGKFVRLLTQVSAGKSTAEHLHDLKSQKSAHDSFVHAMDEPNKCCEERTAMGKIDGGAIKVLPFTT